MVVYSMYSILYDSCKNEAISLVFGPKSLIFLIYHFHHQNICSSRMPIDVSRNTNMNCPLNCNNMSIFDRDMTVLVKYPISLAAILDLVNFEHVAGADPGICNRGAPIILNSFCMHVRRAGDHLGYL